MKENMAEARCFNCLRLQNRISWSGRQKGRLEGVLWGKTGKQVNGELQVIK